MVTADTDSGIQKSINQDSILVRRGRCEKGEVLFAMVCDGMGGLQRGEEASAAVILAFAEWFEKDLPWFLDRMDTGKIAESWTQLMQEQNQILRNCAKGRGERMGTTCSGILLVGDIYLYVHVGDSRIYYIKDEIRQLTRDQTFVDGEIRRGNLTPLQARTDSRRNLLLQCVGASGHVEPEIQSGVLSEGVYLLCTDGFWHEIREGEMRCAFQTNRMRNTAQMHRAQQQLIAQAKARKERDNISVVVIRAKKEGARDGKNRFRD